ncbi:MAG: hypothetical protein HC767_03590 [Akkermansiaceae bacterium]|nr:hypothetical protein [Akkermansiaceae bacterium]
MSQIHLIPIPRVHVGNLSSFPFRFRAKHPQPRLNLQKFIRLNGADS